MGEASLMIAKKISDRATPYNRPENDLKVTYLIFPGTAEKPFGPPDLDRWHAKVSEYLTECGGLGDGYTLHKWENPFPPPPAPATTEPALVVTQQAPGGAGTTTTNPAAAAQQAKQDNAPKPPVPSSSTAPALPIPAIKTQ
jgi:hypothetical protein